jgi:hypothetical protein
MKQRKGGTASGIDEVVQDLRKQLQTLGDRWWLREGWKERFGKKRKPATKGNA